MCKGKQQMKFLKLALIATALVLSTSVNASLVGRDLDGNLATAEAYYDDVADLTWLADANVAGTAMNWVDANNWAANLNVAGVTGWRLADTSVIDAGCVSQSSTQSWGTGCSGSEMGNLFYNVLGNSAGSFSNTGPFSNVQIGWYWSATEYYDPNSPWMERAWNFSFDMTDVNQGFEGYQSYNYQYELKYAWGLQSGDIGTAVSAVPVPAAVWLFGSGLIGLVGFARRTKA